LHSPEYFGEQRDHWWDPEFVSLLLRRWALHQHRRILDVGCGIGHWGRLLLPHLPSNATLMGADREPEWVAKASAIATSRGIGHRTEYTRADANALPFADDAFDLVTCQTLLLHVPDPLAVIREMARVLRPGGHLLVAEPNNLASSQAVGSTRFHEPIDQRIAMTRFQLTCERGKAALGEGNNSIGELMPGLFIEAGLDDVKVCQSDRALPLLPPYASDAERAFRDQMLDWSTRDFWIWSRSDTQRYFLAGGGHPDQFESLWNLAMSLAHADAAALQDKSYHTAGGSIIYLVAATKKAP
jgi:SAM-dependent methyltransferase